MSLPTTRYEVAAPFTLGTMGFLANNALFLGDSSQSKFYYADALLNPVIVGTGVPSLTVGPSPSGAAPGGMSNHATDMDGNGSLYGQGNNTHTSNKIALIGNTRTGYRLVDSLPNQFNHALTANRVVSYDGSGFKYIFYSIDGGAVPPMFAGFNRTSYNGTVFFGVTQSVINGTTIDIVVCSDSELYTLALATSGDVYLSRNVVTGGAPSYQQVIYTSGSGAAPISMVFSNVDNTLVILYDDGSFRKWNRSSQTFVGGFSSPVANVDIAKTRLLLRRASTDQGMTGALNADTMFLWNKVAGVDTITLVTGASLSIVTQFPMDIYESLGSPLPYTFLTDIIYDPVHKILGLAFDVQHFAVTFPFGILPKVQPVVNCIVS